ncbi:MAG: hypothetical protein ACOYT8_06465 [Candidatus Dependentiae bacterium]
MLSIRKKIILTLAIISCSSYAYKNDQSNFLKFWCTKNLQELEEQSLSAMDEIMIHLSYWRAEEKKITTSRLSPSLSSCSLSIIKNNVQALEKAFNQKASFLGTIYQLKNQLKTGSDAAIAESIKKTHKALISEVGRTDTLNDATITRFDSAQKITQDIYSLAVNELPTNFKNSIQPYKRPSWYQANKKYLIAAGALTTALAASYWLHKAAIAKTCNKYVGIVGDFFKNHIIHPLLLIKQIIIDKRNDMIMSQESYDQTKIKTEEKLDKLFQRVDPQLTEEERKHRIIQITVHNNMSYLDDIWHDQFSNFFNRAIWNLYEGKLALLESSSAQILVHKLQTYKILMQASRDLQLLLPVAALTPTALLAFAGYKLTNKSLSALMSEKSPDATIKSIKQNMIAIERIINYHNKNNQTLQNEHIGQLLYHSNQIKKAIKKHKKIDPFIFLQDLAELESLDLTLSQKMAVIDRMYRTYEILGYKL